MWCTTWWLQIRLMDDIQESCEESKFSKFPSQGENVFSFFPLLSFLKISYQYEIMDVSWISHDNHFIIDVNQTIMLYILNLYGDVYQLCLDKSGKRILSPLLYKIFYDIYWIIIHIKFYFYLKLYSDYVRWRFCYGLITLIW